MIKILLPLLGLMLLLSCQDGPKAAFNEDFVLANPKKELPFEKIAGIYKLDDDSKKRFGINDSINAQINIQLNKTFTLHNYYNVNEKKVIKKVIHGKSYYFNDYQFPPYSLHLLLDKIYNNGSVDIYYRKKDSVLVLYIYTPPLKGQEHGDYLRYIKMK